MLPEAFDDSERQRLQPRPVGEGPAFQAVELFPQNRAGAVRSATMVDIHGDRYMDLAIVLDGGPGAAAVGRLGAADCPAAIAAGERVTVRFVMGVMVRVTRETP